MKHLKRFLCLLLCAVFLVPGVSAAQAAGETEKLSLYDVPVASADYSGETVAFYGDQKKFWMEVKDIAALARFSLKEESSDLVLTQGTRTEKIQKDGKGKIPCLLYQGKYLCEGIPTLEYLGAVCKIKDKGLEVLAPACTLWECIPTDASRHYLSVQELHGGADSTEAFLTMDVTMDLLGDSVYKLFVPGMSKDYRKAALYEILDVDMTEYDAAKKTYAEENKRRQTAAERVEAITESGESAAGALTDALGDLADLDINPYVMYKEAEHSKLLESGLTQEAAKVSQEINKSVYEQSVAQEAAGKGSNALGLALFALDTAVTVHRKSSYDVSTRELFSRTTGDAAAYSGCGSLTWKSAADSVTEELSKTKVGMVGDSVRDEAVNEITQMVAREGVSALLLELAKLPAKTALFAVDLGSGINRVLQNKTFEGFSGDLNAMFVDRVEYDSLRMSSALMAKLADSGDSDLQCMVYLRDMLQLYCRSVIAFSENMKKSLTVTGGSDAAQWTAKFDANADWAAGYLYRLGSCVLTPRQDYSALKDDVLTAEWMKQFLADVENNGGTAVGWRGGVYYWKFIAAGVQETTHTGIFQPTLAGGNKLIRRDSQGKETVVCTDKGFGKLYITGGRIYFQTNYSDWASVTPEGKDRKEYKGIDIVGADPASGTLAYLSVSNGSLCRLDKSQKVTVLGQGDDNSFAVMRGSTVYFGQVSGFDVQVSSVDAAAEKPQVKSLGVVHSGTESGTFTSDTGNPSFRLISPGASATMGLWIKTYARLGKSVLYVSCGGQGGSGMVYADGGLFAVALDGSGVRTLLKPGAKDCLQYDVFFVGDQGTDQEAVYYFAGGSGYSAYLTDLIPWIDQDIRKVEPVSGTVSASDETLIPDGSFSCKNGAVYTRLNGSAKSTVVISADMLKAAGYTNLAKTDADTFSCVSAFSMVGDTAYVELQETKRDKSLDVGWRQGYRRIRSRLYAVEPGKQMTLLNEY